MKFRKKPLVVEAEQFCPDKKPWPDGVVAWESHHSRPRDSSFGYMHTAFGRCSIFPGDWVITEKSGEKYPCKNVIFRENYEKVDV